MLLLLACVTEPEPVETEVATPHVHLLPTAGWDPVAIDLAVQRFRDDREIGDEVFHFAEPTVVDASGEAIAMRPVAFHDYDHGWAAADGFQPGAYLVTELAGRAVDPIGFEVSDVGQVPSTFEVGEAWVMETMWSPSGAVDLSGFVWLEILEIDGDHALFRVSAEVEERCDVVTAWGEIDDQGHLTWLEPEIVDPEVDPPFQAWDIWFHLARSADGADLAGVEAQAVVDTRRLDHADEDLDLCDLMPAFGADCVSCPDGEVECLPVAIRGSTLTATDPLGDLPNCGADLSDPEDPDLYFQWDLMICSATALPATLGPLAWLAVALTRRRKTG